MRRTSRTTTLASAALVIALSCAAFMGLGSACSDPYAEEEPVADGPSTPDVSDAGTDAPALVDPCVHARGVAEPDVDDDPTVELPTFTMALREISFNAEAGAPPFGFDLDGVCTCESRPGSARDGGPSCALAPVECDLERGVDNAASKLAATLSPLYPLAEATTGVITKGRRTLLAQVSRYNGKLNDKEVLVSLALSDGIRTSGCPTSVMNTKDGIYTPGWCGDDAWTLRADAVIPGTKQPVLQAAAWVRDGYLAWSLPTVLVPFAEEGNVEIAAAVFSGKLVPLGEDLRPRDRARAPTDREKRLWSIEGGMMGGRIKATRLIAGLGAIEIPGGPDAGSTFVCQSAFFSTIRTQICASTDIARNPRFDFDGITACDALSTGIGLSTFPALVGDVRALSPSGNPCLAGPNEEPPEAGATLYTCQ